MITKIYAVIDKWSHKITQDIEREWSNYPNITFRANADNTIVITGDMIISTIFGEGGKAWLLEYGKGSLMDTDNPYLSEYKGSLLWNPMRVNNDITGRPQGDYQDIDGNTKYSSGKNVGKSLESWAKSQGKEEYMPQEAMHIIRNAVEFALPFILDDIADVVGEEIIISVTRSIPKEILL